MSRPTPLLGDRLKTRRTSLRMTRKQLGAQAGISGQSIVHYEAGERNPSPGVLLNMANALGVSTAWLSGEDVAPDAPAHQASPPRPNLFPLLGERLLSVRKQRRLSREDLAALAGISSRSIVRYEAGEKVPKVGTLGKIAEHLQVRPEWLCGADGEMEAPRLQSFLQAQVAQAPPRPNLFTLVASILALSREDRSALLRLLQSEAQPAG